MTGPWAGGAQVASPAEKWQRNLVIVVDSGIMAWADGSFTKKPMKVWRGSAWVVKPLKVWTGTVWKLT